MEAPTIEILLKGLHSSAKHDLGHALGPNEVKMLLAEIERLRAAAVGADVGANLLVDCAQIIDTIKGEWSQDGSWSEWDQSVRDRITAVLGAIYARAAVGAEVGTDETGAEKSA